MDLIAIYNALNKGKEISIDEITKRNWENFDNQQFWTIAFHTNLPLQNCKLSIFIDNLAEQIEASKPYLKSLLQIAKKDNAPPDILKSIEKAYNTISSYVDVLSVSKRQPKIENPIFEDTYKNPAYKACNGF